MTKKFKEILFTLVVIATFVTLLSIKLLHGDTKTYANAYEAMVTIMPIVGGVLGIMVAKTYGSLKSSFGRGIIFVSLYLIVWGLGQAVWTYYNMFTTVDIPYPSFADVGYLLAIPLGLYGVIKLSSAMGVKYAIRTKVGKIVLIAVPLISFAISYYLIIIVARGGFPDVSALTVKVFTDLAYPIGDIAIIAFILTTIILARKFLGGKFKVPVYVILAGFVLMYIADFGLSYTSTKGTYYNGCWVDYFYTAGLATIAYGLIFLDPNRKKAAPIEAAPVATPTQIQQ